MTGLLVSVLILLLVLVLVHFLCGALPGLAGYRNIIMVVVLIVGIIFILRGVALPAEIMNFQGNDVMKHSSHFPGVDCRLRE